MWAFGTRNYPGGLGEVVFHDEDTQPLAGFLRRSEKASSKTTKVIYNCLPPEEWGDDLPRRSSFKGTYPPALQEQVLVNWTAYGFPPNPDDSRSIALGYVR